MSDFKVGDKVRLKCKNCDGFGQVHPCSYQARNTDDDTCQVCKGTGVGEEMEVVGVYDNFNPTYARATDWRLLLQPKSGPAIPLKTLDGVEKVQ